MPGKVPRTGRAENRVALVTGGASGLGRAIAQRLAAEGARVVITDVQSALGEATAAEMGWVFLEQDVSDEDRWNDLIVEIEARLGGLHILVNNAGIVGPLERAHVESAALADWRRIFSVNVEGVFLGCKAAIPAMRRSGGGSIINVSSVAALQVAARALAYGTSKASVTYITRSVALHCAREGSRIRCNSVHPGNVRTPLLEKAVAEIATGRGVSYQQIFEEFKAVIPQGEFQEPEDIAHAVLFLASDEARHITGAQLVVDGGITLQEA